MQLSPRRYADAIEVLERGLALSPRLEIYRGNLELVKTLAWLRASSPNPGDRDGARAVLLAEAASAAGVDRDPLHLEVLAAAYAEAGRFEDARATIARAIQAANAERPDFVPQLLQRQRLYASDLPYRLQR